MQGVKGFRSVWAGFVKAGVFWAGVAVVGIFLSGCSTIIVAEDHAYERSAAAERTALIGAASAVSQTKWPKPDSNPFGMMLGGDRGSLRESDAIEIYLGSLAGADAASAVLADAEAHLSAAASLASTATFAAESTRPVMADVAVVEGAISELRGIRDIYVGSLKSLKRDGAVLDDEKIRDVRLSFNEAIRDLGRAADALADSVEHNETRSFAGPGRRNFLNGSL